jgi:hypothetical protein
MQRLSRSLFSRHSNLEYMITRFHYHQGRILEELQLALLNIYLGLVEISILNPPNNSGKWRLETSRYAGPSSSLWICFLMLNSPIHYIRCPSKDSNIPELKEVACIAQSGDVSVVNQSSKFIKSVTSSREMATMLPCRNSFPQNLLESISISCKPKKWNNRSQWLSILSALEAAAQYPG